jgi:hypothetical protein
MSFEMARITLKFEGADANETALIGVVDAAKFVEAVGLPGGDPREGRGSRCEREPAILQANESDFFERE